MKDFVLPIVLAVIASNAVFGTIQFFVTRHDTKKKEKTAGDKSDAEIRSTLVKLEMHTTRVELLIMIKLFPTEQQEILKIARRYFAELHGDWYVTGIFNHWLEEHGVGNPDWFHPEA